MTSFLQEKKEMLEELTRKNIFEAAVAIIEEGGWDSLTMDQLAKRAGMSKGTIYYYFKNKEEVIHFIVLRVLEPIAEKVCAMNCESGDPAELFLEVFDILTVDILNNPIGIYVLSVIENDREKLRNMVEYPHVESIQTCLRQVFSRGVRTGVFRMHEPDYYTEFVSMLMCGLGQMILRQEVPEDVEAFRSFLKETIMRGILIHQEQD